MPDPLRICVIGPESTGKSELSMALAAYYRTEWVPEFARQYIDVLNRPYRKEDLLKIAKGQIKLEEMKISNASKSLFIDTNLLVIKVWSEHRYGAVDPKIVQLHESRRYDLYLLTDIDVPWVDDPQREHPSMRKHFLELFHNLVSASGIPFSLVTGLGEDRLRSAVRSIDLIFPGLKPTSL